ncbi:MAG: ABC transporter permease [Anaerolineae bacterium]|nr:ABC transporter permease [Anaerolineae bacterium]
MNTLTYILPVTWKEIQVIAKDRGALAVLFLMPLLFSTLYGNINLQLNREESVDILLNVSLVNQDAGIFGEEIAKALEGIKELNIETFDTAANAEQQVARGDAAAAIIIPADFTQQINDYIPTTIDVIVDPVEPESASIVTGIMNQVVDEVTIWGEVQYGIHTILEESGVFDKAGPEAMRAIEAQNMGVIMTRLSEMRRNPTIVVSSEDLAGAKIEGGIALYFALLFPGITVMFVFFVVSSSSSALLGEREAGTLRRLLAGPIPRGAIIAGKMLAYILLICLQVIVLLSVGNIFFDMPLGTSPVGLVVLTLVVALAATAMGMMIAALSKTAKQADNIGTVMGFVLGGIGGCIAITPTPITRSGGFMSILARLTPHGNAIEAYYSLMAENATFGQIVPEIGIILAMALVFYLIAVWRFKFEV